MTIDTKQARKWIATLNKVDETPEGEVDIQLLLAKQCALMDIQDNFEALLDELEAAREDLQKAYNMITKIDDVHELRKSLEEKHGLEARDE